MITKKMAGMKQVLLWMIVFGLLILTIQFLERLRLFNEAEIYDAYPLPVVSETLPVIPVDLSIPEGAEHVITASPVPTRSPYPTPSAPQETNSTLFPTAIAPNDASGVIIVFQLQEGDVPVLRVIPVNGTGNVDEFKDERIIPIVTTPEFEELLPSV